MSLIQKKAICALALASAETAYNEGRTEFVFCNTLFKIERFGRTAARCTVNGNDCGIRILHGEAVFA